MRCVAAHYYRFVLGGLQLQPKELKKKRGNERLLPCRGEVSYITLLGHGKTAYLITVSLIKPGFYLTSLRLMKGLVFLPPAVLLSFLLESMTTVYFVQNWHHHFGVDFL